MGLKDALLEQANGDIQGFAETVELIAAGTTLARTAGSPSEKFAAELIFEQVRKAVQTVLDEEVKHDPKSGLVAELLGLSLMCHLGVEIKA